MEDIFTLPKVCALVLAIAAAAIDYRTRKIPNALTFPATFVGLGVQSWYYMMHSHLGKEAGLAAGALSAILGWLVGTGLMVTAKFFLKLMGHGDSKLMGALGSFLGPAEIILTYGFYSLCYGLYASFALWSKFPWGQLAFSLTLQKSGVDTPKLDLTRFNQARKETIPVAPIIAAGLLAMILFEKAAWQFMGFD